MRREGQMRTVIFGAVIGLVVLVVSLSFAPKILNVVNPIGNESVQDLGNLSGDDDGNGGSSTQTGTEAWSVTAPGPVESSPTFKNGKVYIGGSHVLYALDSDTGNKKWEYDAGTDIWAKPVLSNGVVFVGTINGKMLAVNSGDGSVKWSKNIVDRIIVAGVEVYNGEVYVPVRESNSFAGDAPGNLSIRYADGGARDTWFQTSYSIETRPEIENGHIYVTTTGGYLYRIDASNLYNWNAKQFGSEIRSSPTVATVDGERFVFFGQYGGKVYKVNTALGVNNTFHTGQQVRSQPTVKNGAVYVGSNNEKIYKLDATTMDKIWAFETGGPVVTQPAVVGGTVYVTSMDGKLYALDADTGNKKWEFSTGGGITSSPAVGDDKVYFGSRDGKIYAVNR
ncbi:MAG: PQQ-binding-like beta-propeller repeat protein [Candidatus Nanohaloarchaea archaeon]